jgi:hypothetical protein
MRQVVTAGASLSGVTAADALRYECYEGSVVSATRSTRRARRRPLQGGARRAPRGLQWTDRDIPAATATMNHPLPSRGSTASWNHPLRRWLMGHKKEDEHDSRTDAWRYHGAV